MTVLVDTGVLYALHDDNAARHEAAKRAMATVAEGHYGRPVISDYVYDETVTLALSRFEDSDRASRISDRLLGRGDYPDLLKLLFVDRELFFETVSLHDQYSDQSLSFTDATTVAFVEERGVDQVLSFDDDFDGIVPRLDPSEV